MLQINTIITAAFAVRECRAADGIAGMECISPPPSGRINYNDIRAGGANSARHVAVHEKGL